MRVCAATENATLESQAADQRDDAVWTNLARDSYTSSQDNFNSSLRREFEAAQACSLVGKRPYILSQVL